MDHPPYRRSVPAINAPAIVLISIAAFAAVHLLRMILPPVVEVDFLLYFAFIPARFTAPPEFASVVFPGGLAAGIWTFFSYAFIHGDWLHLGVNSLWMLAFGSLVARHLGAGRFAAFSLVCAAAGAAVMLIVLWGEMVPLIGASAAVSGQMAAAVRLMYGNGRGDVATVAEALREPRALIFLAVWIGINLLFGLDSFELNGAPARIAWEAHLAGFATGFVLFGLFDRIGRPPGGPPVIRL